MRRNKVKDVTIPALVAKGALVSVLALLIIISGLTTIVLKGLITEEYYKVIEAGVSFLSVLIGCTFTLKSAKNGKILIAILVLLSYTFIMITLNIIAFNGGFRIAWLDILSTLLGATLSVFLDYTISEKVKHKSRYR